MCLSFFEITKGVSDRKTKARSHKKVLQLVGAERYLEYEFVEHEIKNIVVLTFMEYF